jgi:hypothetical protein
MFSNSIAGDDDGSSGIVNPPLLEHAVSERQHNKTANNFFTNTPVKKKPNRVGLLTLLNEVMNTS